jgi:carboxymethylenebutenolidase
VGHIKDVTRRFAKDGFAAIGVDLMSRIGGSDKWNGSDEATKEIQKINGAMAVEDLTAAVAYMKKQSYVNGKVGVVGYCWGGGQSLNFATKCKDLNAAVVYYGRNPDPLDSVANIPCKVMGNYAADDPNIMPGVEPLKAALAKAGKSFDCKVFDGAKHAFNNNTNADRYNPEAAKDAWARTSSFFKANLA